MTEDFNQIDKKMLAEHYDRFLRTNYTYKRLQLQFLWKFLHGSELFSPLCGVIKQKALPRFDQNRYWIVWDQKANPLPDSPEERIQLSYAIIEDIVINNHDSTIMYRIGKQYLGKQPGTETDYFNLFNDLFLEPFILFLNHHAIKNILILELLKKYKHKTEWFTGEKLFEMVQNNSRKAEQLLTSDLYSYLFDKGLNFHIEPKAPSGRLDFVGSQQNSPNKILIEGKLFDADGRSKSYLVQGFHQLLTYTKTFNEDKSYLVIYNISPKHLTINIQGDSSGFSCFLADNRRVYLIVIDIFIHQEPASTRPKADIVEINEADLR